MSRPGLSGFRNREGDDDGLKLGKAATATMNDRLVKSGARVAEF